MELVLSKGARSRDAIVNVEVLVVIRSGNELAVAGEVDRGHRIGLEVEN
jgi:hypothetical protein